VPPKIVYYGVPFAFAVKWMVQYKSNIFIFSLIFYNNLTA